MNKIALKGHYIILICENKQTIINNIFFKYLFYNYTNKAKKVVFNNNCIDYSIYYISMENYSWSIQL